MSEHWGGVNPLPTVTPLEVSFSFGGEGRESEVLKFAGLSLFSESNNF